MVGWVFLDWRAYSACEDETSLPTRVLRLAGKITATTATARADFFGQH